MEEQEKRTDNGLCFRLMRLEDIPTIVELEKQAFTLPWTAEAFRNELKRNHFARYMAMELDGKIIGYGGMWTIMDEAHVTNIAVHQDYRGQKLGARLLSEMMRTASYVGMRKMTLEVRVSNTVAQNLYKKFGFTSAGIRPRYYSDNNEDAMIMWADIPAEWGAIGMEEAGDNHE
ncbi:ribosomal-protein-alanine N-acetyltransferase [Paenibacillus selenitireducens]|uniref:Ribosomal-protein-alanine N-acetyltransferase n=1 Tax=Paenibacillus selenitireducens TaxID=1324314 RepID=A0A1T2X2K9_9BACL|nr:ribosomal protein S18-alanine N-acetyltransferase [Paenibacillus selenitireducens]OPA74092.1 ribosomal-protein-alanine N-acetyltransferase [Paenibacillus selenitireducens]